MIKKPVIDTQDCLFSKNRFYLQLHLRWGVIFLFIVFIANFESRVWLNSKWEWNLAISDCSWTFLLVIGS